jgi:hypothetical protein
MLPCQKSLDVPVLSDALMKKGVKPLRLFVDMWFQCSAHEGTETAWEGVCQRELMKKGLRARPLEGA